MDSNLLARADAALGDAVKLAEKLPERSLYLTEWARNATLNTDISEEERDNQLRDRTDQLRNAPSIGGSSGAKQAALLVGKSLTDKGKLTEAINQYNSVLSEYDKADPAKPLDPAKADGSDASLLLARAFCRCFGLSDAQWNLTAAESVLKDASRVVQLKPGAHLEALADWCAASAKLRSTRSNSATFTAAKKQDYLKSGVDDVKKAIEAAPNDPDSWEWRRRGAIMLGTMISLSGASTPPDLLKTQAAEARRWIDDAIEMAAKRPNLADKLESIQRDQQDLEKALTAKGMPRT